MGGRAKGSFFCIAIVFLSLLGAISAAHAVLYEVHDESSNPALRVLEQEEEPSTVMGARSYLIPFETVEQDTQGVFDAHWHDVLFKETLLTLQQSLQIDVLQGELSLEAYQAKIELLRTDKEYANKVFFEMRERKANKEYRKLRERQEDAQKSRILQAEPVITEESGVFLLELFLPFVVFCVAAVVLNAIQKKRNLLKYHGRECVGIGGWLLLFILILVVRLGFNCYIFGDLIQSYDEYISPYDSLGVPLLVSDIAILSSSSCLMGVGLYRLLTIHPKAISFVFIMLYLDPVVLFGGQYLQVTLFKSFFPAVYAELPSGT